LSTRERARKLDIHIMAADQAAGPEICFVMKMVCINP